MKNKVPFYIRFIGMFFPICKYEINSSNGEIRKFSFTNYPGSIGEIMFTFEIIENKEYEARWVHLGRNYYKKIFLVLSSSY